MKKYLYYKLSKEDFLKCYKLTKQDKEDIDDSVNKLKLSNSEATGLRLHKIYEDSKWDDLKFKTRVFDVHLKNMENRIKNMSYT